MSRGATGARRQINTAKFNDIDPQALPIDTFAQEPPFVRKKAF
jgi:hypothetical protein